MVYIIDSNPFIWGIKREAHKDQNDYIRRAQEFFKWADYHKHNILIPSVVVSEILVPEPEESVAEYLQIIDSKFIVAEFDVRVAKVYSRILHGKAEEIKRNCRVLEITKQQMKIDHIIVATALSYGATALISHDKGLQSFSAGLVKTEELKDHYNYGSSPQVSIFDSIL